MKLLASARYVKTGDLKSEKKIILEGLRHDTTASDLYFELAEIERLLGNLSAAGSYYSRASKYDPTLYAASSGVIAALGWLGAANGLAEDRKALQADGQTNIMLVHWDQASPKIIAHLDKARLERGEVLCEIKNIDAQTVAAQTVGLIEADPAECFKIVRKYNQYVQIMPGTVENRVIRSLRLEGDYAGAEAVDFWTRVRVLGFDTGYLLRIVHLIGPQSNRFRSFWTLVDNPAQVVGVCGSGKPPCENGRTRSRKVSRFGASRTAQVATAR